MFYVLSEVLTVFLITSHTSYLLTKISCSGSVNTIYFPQQPFGHEFWPYPGNTAGLFWSIGNRMNRVPLHLILSIENVFYPHKSSKPEQMIGIPIFRTFHRRKNFNTRFWNKCFHFRWLLSYTFCFSCIHIHKFSKLTSDLYTQEKKLIKNKYS